MMQSRWVILVLLLVAVAGALVIVRGPSPAAPPPDGSIPVVASFYPLAEFTRQVGGERVAVTQITAGGVDVHEFQLSPRHIATIQSARLFLYNGGGIEPWAERVHAEAERQGVRVVNMLDTLGQEQVRVQSNGSVNPHIWLDPILAQRQIAVIRDALIDVDPARADAYRANAERYLSDLRALDQSYRDALAACAQREVIVAHDAFRHLTERYGLTLVPLAGLSPDAKARPRELAEVVQRARTAGIRTVFSEVLVSSGVLQTFARDVGAEVRALHPLEGLTSEELTQGKDYLSLMQENLKALRAGLDCR